MYIEINIDKQTRDRAKAIFSRLGLTEEQAVTMFYKRTVAAGRMPFGEISEAKPKVKRERMNKRFAEWDAF